MKMRCLIIDDEPLAHDVIRTYAEDVPFLEICGQCYRATEALDFLSRHPVDLIFLDIRMPRLTGLDLLKTLTRKPLVIITSAYEEYALESFDLDVSDYLLKPFRFDRFLKAVNRALADFSRREPVLIPPSLVSPAPAQIYIRSDKKQVLVNLDEIYYLESLGNYVKVWRETGFLLTPRTLSSFENQLPADAFIRIHKSYLLNKPYVQFIEGHTIVLRNGKRLPVGKNYRQLVQDWIVQG
ncbi:LytR/AlgR family response regulator transcription factor [Larkinella humicola]|uniref:Response regulator transcription factor n=1 Tax=Larkinella humicola TaxID=2607654 RepID=A0A5N1J6R9_9BACT|nr:LytTR family DNA-binding domain-containing protein [Larkinella humicola]KAA9346707.1 response regulator transcription factor [Larkinella humicola]